MEPPKRPWFQLHLSTYFVLMVLIAVLWGLYVTVFSDIYELFAERRPFGKSSFWQWITFWQWGDLISFVALPLVAFVLVAYVCERSIRRSEHLKPDK
jgi:uncharacterized BrkB/YihY/UPF0761 family membrane protein